MSTAPVPRSIAPIQILTDDDKAEIYSLVMSNPTAGQEGVLLMDVADRINLILYDKIKEIIELIDKQLQTNPMNGDGHNYSLNKAVIAISKKYDLEIGRNYKYNGEYPVNCSHDWTSSVQLNGDEHFWCTECHITKTILYKDRTKE